MTRTKGKVFNPPVQLAAGLPQPKARGHTAFTESRWPLQSSAWECTNLPSAYTHLWPTRECRARSFVQHTALMGDLHCNPAALLPPQ